MKKQQINLRRGRPPGRPVFILKDYHTVILRALTEESLQYNNCKIDYFDIFIASKFLHYVQDTTLAFV